MSMSISTNALRWLDILENEFDKAFVDLDLLLSEIDDDQFDIITKARSKMTVFSSCFAQIIHKTQTISQINAKLETQLSDLRVDIINLKVEQQTMEQQMKETLTQLQTSKLECQILKNQGNIENVELIRKKLTQQLSQQSDEFRQNLLSNVKAYEFEKENKKLELENLNLHSEIYGLRLTNKYLDKELAGRIQQIQLLGRDLHGPIPEQLWNQLEAEIHLNRHKTVIRACRGKEIFNNYAVTPSGHDFDKLKRPQRIGEIRTIKLHKDAKEPLGMSITGGKEHGLPILISEIRPNQLVARCGQLYIGDAILSVNEHDLHDKKHDEVVDILSSVSGDITMTVVFVAPDNDDDDEDLSKITKETETHLNDASTDRKQHLTVINKEKQTHDDATIVISKYLKHIRHNSDKKSPNSNDQSN